MIPGVEVVPLEESEICCGAAGTYNLTQPEMSERLGKRKMDNIEKTGATIVATGNVGCIMQIPQGEGAGQGDGGRSSGGFAGSELQAGKRANH